MTETTNPFEKRPVLYVIQILWILVLAALAFIYFTKDGFFLPKLGSVPIGVPWWGALGAVLISVTGIVDHFRDWEPGYNLWHFSRPFIGAILAVVSVLIFQAGILSSGSPINATNNQPQNVILYLIAFLVGYREKTFRDLITRLVDLILTPITSQAAPTITSVSRAGDPQDGKIPITVQGLNFTGITSVVSGNKNLDFKINSDTGISAQVPVTSATGQASVTVINKGGSATTLFEF
jgi:hypothetical protein